MLQKRSVLSFWRLTNRSSVMLLYRWSVEHFYTCANRWALQNNTVSAEIKWNHLPVFKIITGFSVARKEPFFLLLFKWFRYDRYVLGGIAINNITSCFVPPNPVESSLATLSAVRKVLRVLYLRSFTEIAFYFFVCSNRRRVAIFLLLSLVITVVYHKCRNKYKYCTAKMQFDVILQDQPITHFLKYIPGFFVINTFFTGKNSFAVNNFAAGTVSAYFAGEVIVKLFCGKNVPFASVSFTLPVSVAFFSFPRYLR